MPQRSSLGYGLGQRYRCVLSCSTDHAARLSSNYGQSEDRQGCFRRRVIESGTKIKAIERLVQILHRGPFQDARAQSGGPRWTHKHRRFANLSVLPSKSSSISRIILNYIMGSSSSTSRRHRRSSSTSRQLRGVLNMRHSPKDIQQ